jgi:hypothetical protein
MATMEGTAANYRHLDSEKIIATIESLKHRIDRRFPDAGLGGVVEELLRISRKTVERTTWIQKPHLPLRIAAGFLIAAIIALLVLMLLNIRQFRFDDYGNFIQAFESSISSMVFIGAAILFFLSWENRIKRRRALDAVHELRAIAHIVDMHQLTKDPESYFAPTSPAFVPARRGMSPFELNRYLDYCSETLALVSKIAALYVQNFQDPVLLDAVDDVEDLAAGFSRKIWQKITILETLGKVIGGDKSNPNV